MTTVCVMCGKIIHGARHPAACGECASRIVPHAPKPGMTFKVGDEVRSKMTGERFRIGRIRMGAHDVVRCSNEANGEEWDDGLLEHVPAPLPVTTHVVTSLCDEQAHVMGRHHGDRLDEVVLTLNYKSGVARPFDVSVPIETLEAIVAMARAAQRAATR